MLRGIGGRRRRGLQRMAGWHHRLNGHEFEWTPGLGNGQGDLACCNSWGRKDTTEWLNWTELKEDPTDTLDTEVWVSFPGWWCFAIVPHWCAWGDAPWLQEEKRVAFSHFGPSHTSPCTYFPFSSVSSVAQSCPTLCDPMDSSTPGLPVHHQLPEFTQTHVHWVSDAIQPPHSLLFPSPPAFNLS